MSRAPVQISLYLRASRAVFPHKGSVKAIFYQIACDTMRRYIYLHGSPPTAQMGEPGSIGCVRISGEDIIALFDAVEAGTTVHPHD